MSEVHYDADELVPVELDKLRHLVFTVAAFREICRRAATKDLKLALKKTLEEGLDGMLILACAGLRHEWPDVNEDTLAAILTPKRTVRLQEAIGRALMGEQTEAAEDAPADPPTASSP